MTCNNVLCPACDSPFVKFAVQGVSGDSYSVLFCNNCRIGTTEPQPDDTLLHELYSTQYYRNGEGARFIQPVEWIIQGMRRLRIYRLAKHVKTGRALDIGCGSGRFLQTLQAFGWAVAGLELSDETATSARTINGLFVETSLNAFAENSFNLITMTHVLEHIRDPLQVLTKCSGLLKDGGIIAVAVPNIDSWQARITTNNWFHLDLPRHLWHFSESWLTKTFLDLGFEPVTVRRLDLAHNTFGWMQSLLNFIVRKHNCLYEYLSCSDIKTGELRHHYSLVASFALAPVLLPLSFALAVIESVCMAGGTVEVMARKRAFASAARHNIPARCDCNLF